ncbi:hypothetical protein [Methylovorus mays]|uniref:hypothetical protein n=1 Tax=Methylovorus mays TaxID=184077 RepID=UPI001E3A8926|nr:hypothetical protein [Methylovorus mays]MCB5207099.1 hypothetical protein [Methylovorus mays]
MSSDNFHSHISLAETSNSWEIEQLIDEVLGEYIHDPLVWAIRPYLGLKINKLMLLEPFDGQWIKEYFLSIAKLKLPFVNSLRDNYFSARIEGYALCNQVMSFWVTRNQRLALNFVTEEKSSLLPRNVAISDPIISTEVYSALSTKFSKKILAFVAPLINDAARFRYTAAHLLDIEKPRVLVVASNESIKTRLMVAEARKREIPSVYIPHAPTALVRRYADIVTDVALLRGISDLEYYSQLGAKTDGLKVMGDPTINIPMDSIAKSGKIILSCTVSSLKNERLLHQLGDHPLCKNLGIVAIPHPAGEKMRISYYEKKYGIVFSRLRTSDYLIQHGAAVVISPTSSGALLEALSMGIPVIATGMHPQYAFECRLDVRRVSNTGELLSVVDEVIHSDTREKRMLRKQSVADWIHTSGEKARVEINNLINQPVKLSGPILDSWGKSL